MSALISGISLLACLSLLGGCITTSKTPPEPESTQPATENTLFAEPEDLEIVESGWSASEGGYVQYGIGISNPNADFEAQAAKVSITGKDADGKIVFTGDERISFILPEGESYLGGQIGNGTVPETVEFSISVDEKRWVASDHTSSAIFEVSNPNEIIGEYYTDTYTGELSANLEWDDVNQVRTCVILRDDAGSIVYGAMGIIDCPTKGQTVPFEITAFDAPQHASYELNAIPF